MSDQLSDRSRATRNAALHWLLWGCEVVITVLVLALLVAVGLPLTTMIGSGEGLEHWAAVMLGLFVVAILVGVLLAMVGRLIRGMKQPLDARRLHGSSVALGAFAFLCLAMVGMLGLDGLPGDDAELAGISVVTLAAAMLAWIFHRLLFTNMLKWTGIVDDRTFDERYEPARHFIAAIALLMLNVFNTTFLIGRDNPVDEHSLLIVGAPLLGALLFYKITVTITARRIRKKLAAAEPPAAREGGAV